MSLKHLFISESDKGIHGEINEGLDASLLSFTFYPRLSTISRPVVNLDDVNVAVVKNQIRLNHESAYADYEIKYFCNILPMVTDIVEKQNGEYVFVGFDLDAMGQLMASVLYYKLIEHGFPKENIIRVPLIDRGYDYIDECDYLNIGFGEFYQKKQLFAILEAMRFEEMMMKNSAFRTGFGYRKMSALEHFVNRNKSEEVIRKNKYTNLATYVTKKLIKEIEKR